MTHLVSGTVQIGFSAFQQWPSSPEPKVAHTSLAPEWLLWFSCPKKQVKLPAGRGDSESRLPGDETPGSQEWLSQLKLLLALDEPNQKICFGFQNVNSLR